MDKITELLRAIGIEGLVNTAACPMTPKERAMAAFDYYFQLSMRNVKLAHDTQQKIHDVLTQDQDAQAEQSSVAK